MSGMRGFFNTFTGQGKQERQDQANAKLYRAVKEGNLTEVKKLLKDGANPNVQYEHHLTTLHQAAYWGETEIVKELLKYQAKVDLDNGKGWTALHSAAVSGGLKRRAEIIDLLVNAGSDLNKPDRCGWSPKDYMLLWEENSESAQRLKEYLGRCEANENQVLLPQRPLKVHTPKH